MLSVRPCAAEGLDVNELSDGLIVYDPVTERIHYLNSTAAMVYTLCDGEHDADTMAALIASAFELDQPPLGEIQDCLSAFDKEGLVR